MDYPSPRTPGTTPTSDFHGYRMPSATPTPPHHASWMESQPPRPATRATHSRGQSYSHQQAFSPRPPKDSPRYNSSGQYSTQDVSYTHFPSSRRPSKSSHSRPSKRDRQPSFTYVRTSTPYGESDEDEIIETLNGTYVLPAQSSFTDRHRDCFPREHDGVRYTNHGAHPQDASFQFDNFAGQEKYAAPTQQYPPSAFNFGNRAPTSLGQRQRRSSVSVPQRPQTVRPMANPGSRHQKMGSIHTSRPAKTSKPQPREQRSATVEDQKRYGIPNGYSLKNWDPDEEPILLLGSVFDSNTLGKWVYDWTVHAHGAGSPLADEAGELWLQMIGVFTKMRSADDVLGRIRQRHYRTRVKEFVARAKTIHEDLEAILRTCERTMVVKSASGRKEVTSNAGVQFVNALFHPEQQGDSVNELIAEMRYFQNDWEANSCDRIVANPTA